MVALESFAKVLHFLHLVAGVTSLAACTHLLVRLLRRRHDARVRTHAAVLGVAYLSTYAFGALMYPTFRVRVRAELLDRVYPWATGLFEIKEHAASLVLVPVAGVFLLSRALDPKSDADRHHYVLLGGLATVVFLVLVFNACVGWYLGTLRSV